MQRFSYSSITSRSVSRKVTVPIYASVTAGNPEDGEIRVVGHRSIDLSEHWHGLKYFRIHGNSMKNDTRWSIEDGNIVIVNTFDQEPKYGQVYLWQIPGRAACIKAYGWTEELGNCLVSHNPQHEPFIPADGALVIGRVIGKLLDNDSLSLFR